MKERWTLSGKYFDEDYYSETFDNIFEVLDTINTIQNNAEDPSWDDSSEVINPITLKLENDNNPKERIEIARKKYHYL